MTLVPFAAKDVLRNRRRTISSILGVLLAVVFVAGTFIAIDSSARATLEASLAGIPGDFSFYLYVNDPSTFNRTTIERNLLNASGVVDASLYRTLPIWEYENADPKVGVIPYGVTTLGINPEHLPSMLRDLDVVAGSLALPPGSVGVTRDVATQLSVGMGDTIVAQNRVNETAQWRVNLTVAAILETPTYTYYGGVVVSPRQYYGFGFVVVHINDADWLLTQLGQPRGFESINGEVWIDRAAYVNPYDVDATTRSLERIQRRLQTILGPYTTYVQNNILARIQDFSNRVAAQRIQYFLLSMPVVLLGIYLGAVGVDLSHAERRRELAVLKTRGARRGQLVGLLVLEAIVGGLLAAALGLAIGVFLSRFLLDVVNPSSAALPYESFILTTDTILAVAIVSMLLMFLVSYRSAKRTASLPIVETLRYHVPGETKIQYSPRVDIALVTVGLLDYVLVWWRGGGAPTNVWTFLLGIAPFLLLPFVPIMLIIGSTRLLTRSTGKVYDWFSRAVKPLVGELYHVIRRNLVRNPRRSSNVAIIIALGLAFGTFTLSILGTQNAHTEREIRASVGSDMAVYPIVAGSNLTSNLTAVSDVAGVAEIVYFQSVRPLYCCGSVWGMDPDPYFGVAQPESWLFADGNPTRAHDSLATPGQALISQAYYDQAFIEVGDLLRLEGDVYDQNGTWLGTVQANVTIAGVVRSLPGMNFGYSPVIFASLDTLAPFRTPPASPYGAPSERYLIDLGPGADWRSVKAAILADSSVGSVSVADEQVEALTANPFARALYQFIAMELVFIGIILTAGVGLILYAASLERDVEFAAIIARGSSGWQTAKLLVGEAFVIMLVGLVVGVSVGTGTAFFATQFFATGPPGTPPPAVPYFFVFPLDAVLLVLLAPGAMLLSALLVSARTARMNVGQVLKLRGG